MVECAIDWNEKAYFSSLPMFGSPELISLADGETFALRLKKPKAR